MTRDELSKRVFLINQIFTDLVDDVQAYNALDPHRRQQLETGINKSYGQAMGFFHEFLTTQKNQRKGRTVVTQLHGDVTVGEAEQMFAKLIECKNITRADKGSVNAEINKAIEQVGGQTGFVPRDEDVRVVDVRIYQPCNPWPIAGGGYDTPRGPQQLNTILNQAVTEIRGLVDSVRPGATAVRNWLIGQNIGQAYGFGRLQDVLIDDVWKPHPKSTRPIYVGPHGVDRVRCLSVKVRWDPPYRLITAPNVIETLSMIVVQAYVHPMSRQLTVEIARQEVNHTVLDDLFNGFDMIFHEPMEEY